MGTEKAIGKSARWKQLAAGPIGTAAGLIILTTIVAKLAGVELPGALSLLNNNGIWILLIPVMGLFAIFRHGRWTGWKVVESSTLLSVVCWFGWASALIIGVVYLIVGR